MNHCDREMLDWIYETAGVRAPVKTNKENNMLVGKNSWEQSNDELTSQNDLVATQTDIPKKSSVISSRLEVVYKKTITLNNAISDMVTAFVGTNSMPDTGNNEKNVEHNGVYGEILNKTNVIEAMINNMIERINTLNL